MLRSKASKKPLTTSYNRIATYHSAVSEILPCTQTDRHIQISCYFYIRTFEYSLYVIKYIILFSSAAAATTAASVVEAPPNIAVRRNVSATAANIPPAAEGGQQQQQNAGGPPMHGLVRNQTDSLAELCRRSTQTTWI